MANQRKARQQQGLLVGIVVVAALLLSFVAVSAQGPLPQSPQATALNLGTGFTYQGQLKSGGAAVNGTCDFQFALYDALTLGARIGTTQTVASLAVANGLFAAQIDFGTGAMTGDARFLNMQVRCPAGAGAYTALTPRQTLTPSPMALALPGLWTQQNATSPNIVGGYSGNVISPTLAGETIGGGGNSIYPNRAYNNYATVGGGIDNVASGWGATVAGGGTDSYIIIGNQALGLSSAIGGGLGNTASDAAAVVAGGYLNTASGNTSFVGGGDQNIASGAGAVVGGGGYDGSNESANSARGGASFIGGGNGNSVLITATEAAIGGGLNNTAGNSYVTVAGGDGNIAGGQYSGVGGGQGNAASSGYATIGGGLNNTASGILSTIAGGNHTLADNLDATVGGGYYNHAGGPGATISGGGYDGITASENEALGGGSAIAGGVGNVIDPSGTNAFIAGGNNNYANGVTSFAGGNQARANNQGCFVWADSTLSDFDCGINDAFYVRASGGITLYSNSAATSGVAVYPGSGSWSFVSDRNAKLNFNAVDGRTTLAQLMSIPIQTWSYKTQDAAIRHIGPMAQDFSAAFNVGENNTTISAVDAQGVALAAIQGLNDIVQEQRTQIDGQQQEIATLKQQVAALQTQNTTMDARLTALENRTPAPVALAGALPIAVTPEWLLGAGVMLIGLVLARKFGFGGKA